MRKLIDIPDDQVERLKIEAAKNGVSLKKYIESKLRPGGEFKSYDCHDAVYKARKSGELIQKPCEQCGSDESVAHHDDYSKPLDVRWLCVKCHNIHHGVERRNGIKQCNALDNPKIVKELFKKTHSDTCPCLMCKPEKPIKKRKR